MDKCKFCQEELAEETTLCPSCGKDNAPAEPAAEEREETAENRAEEQEASVTEPETEDSGEREEETPEDAAQASEEPAVSDAPGAEESPEEAPAKKMSPGKIALVAAAAVVLAALMIALVMGGRKQAPDQEPALEAAQGASEEAVTEPVSTIPADGNPEDVTCKGSYTVEDAAAEADKDVEVAFVGGQALTNGQLRIYYRSAMSSYLSTEQGYSMLMYGLLDLSRPLETQVSVEADGQTWQQFFLQSALENWQLAQAMALEAQKNGADIAPENKAYLESLRESLELLAEENEMPLEEMLRADFGAGVTYEDFEAYQRLHMAGDPYYQIEAEKLVPSEEELDAFFQAHEGEFASSGVTKENKVLDVRHILVQVEGGTADETGAMTYSEEAWEACEKEAQEILDAWLAGEKTEESFAALANEKSEDPGSSTNGGLYENVYQGQMVEPFEAWCFDESRQYGDYGLVQTSYGYHVMFFVESRPMWKAYAESGWFNEQVRQLLVSIKEAHPMEVGYEDITLGALKTN